MYASFIYIFSDTSHLLEFLKDATTSSKIGESIVERFTSFCKKRNLPVEKTLSEIIGGPSTGLQIYEANCSVEYTPLDEYFAS